MASPFLWKIFSCRSSETTQKIALLQHLQESEKRFQSFIRNASVGIIVLMGTTLKVAVVNEAYGRLIGRSVDELLGKWFCFEPASTDSGGLGKFFIRPE